ncbi:FKBP-type 22 kDa peptidyl-prolyl cis-trans isomerase [termite gut metagenome]|uniref:peptidylprolyl isomerase n=1 Tax=termite gut metagenome TaxID=433724 RepID=A0A5J4SY16_9ZZZZ
MKKVCCLMVAIIAVISFVSCTAQNPKAKLTDELDSLAYSMGLAQSQGLRDYLERGMNVDTAYMDEFIKGLNRSVHAGENSKQIKKELAYYAGIQIGQQVERIVVNINNDLFDNDSIQKFNKNNFVAGLIHGTIGKGELIPVVEAEAYSQTTSEAVKARKVEEKYTDNKAEGEKFLEENKTKEGVQTTASGLQYKVIVKGNGAVPTADNSVKVHYKGTLIDGTEFDSSLSRKEPATFRVDQVIKGWTEALTIMPVGSKWELYVPQELAYGSKETNNIKPFSTLIFEVELLGIEKK